ncbi:ABC transporter ATP-binding protein [Cryptosporangium aurantiacum]|uniref:ABC-2 type transport system ATP-binding protein n=1 Tax=Cryptosporangium aurantiacum TaxID=134849 RepID=A0A1M7RMP7_9ACTN|nr:ATP-binding cassette domain-containing protein [Cryptosporangium aurantiacum]SHN47605.1 ABC-2 type transport system ATP-binding protein [Cryptosporangium aurantiacum]
MIEIHQLTKRYGRTLAVDGLSFTVPAGQVTGFLGANGAGKSTTLRAILGLDRPTAGHALVDGRPYTHHRRPMQVVGAVLDASAVHGGRRGRTHLRALARSNGLSPTRVDAVLDEVGLTAVADRRIGGYSLGMRQRLAIAGALLGDPGTLIFDEPLNGLDPEGIRWFRSLAGRLARDGRAVLVSSHLMTEMAQTADRVVVIGNGRLLAEDSLDAFGPSLEEAYVRLTEGASHV